MRIAFFVNGLSLERPRFTTTLLAREAVRRGHEVFYVEAESFLYQPNDVLEARAVRAPGSGDVELRDFLRGVRENEEREQLDTETLDVLLLRNDPAIDAEKRPWAQSVGIIFGQMAARRGVLVLNDPVGLSGAMNKLYFQYFPAAVRPKSLITRTPDAVKRFIDDHGGSVVLKPLQGSGGQSVFLVREDDHANLNQMIEAVMRDGYLIAQEYLPAAAEGDIRFFLMNGVPLVADGAYAALRRVGATGDLRSNMHAGGTAEKVEIGEVELRIAEIVRPKLVQDGMFLVGLDIAGDKLMEINVFSPGGLCSACDLEGADFGGAILDSLERKVRCVREYRGHFDNVRLATI